MSAATPRTISNAPDLRQLLVAVGALILAVALLVAVTISRQTSFEAAPAAAPATVNHDHGWSSSAGSQDLVVSTDDGGIVYTGIPYVTFPKSSAPVVTGVPTTPSVPYVTFPQSEGLVVATQNGAIQYTGIPYTAPAEDDFVYTGYPTLGRELFVRTESGGIRYMGIPYSASAAGPQGGGSNGTRFPQ